MASKTSEVWLAFTSTAAFERMRRESAQVAESSRPLQINGANSMSGIDRSTRHIEFDRERLFGRAEFISVRRMYWTLHLNKTGKQGNVPHISGTQKQHGISRRIFIFFRVFCNSSISWKFAHYADTRSAIPAMPPVWKATRLDILLFSFSQVVTFVLSDVATRVFVNFRLSILIGLPAADTTLQKRFLLPYKRFPLERQPTSR